MNAGDFKRLFSIDLRSLALFRVCIGSLVLQNFISLASSYEAFYSETGILPLRYAALTMGRYEHSAFMLSSSPVLFFALWFVAAAAAAAFIIGWHTRISAFLMWYLLMSLHLRNPLVITGADYLIRYLAFWCIFLPMGEKYAWEAPASAGKRNVSGLAVFALMMQTVYMYISATYFKCLNAEWLNGQALYYSFSMADAAAPLGSFLLNYREPLVFMSYFALFVEGVGPLLLFVPRLTDRFRAIAIALFLMLQGGILLSMDVYIFPLVATTAIIPFVPGSWWDRVSGWKYAPFVRKLFDRPSFLGSAPRMGKNEPLTRKLLAWTALIFSVSVLFNLIRLAEPKLDAGRWIQMPAWPVKMNQNWCMFAPRGHFPNHNSWYVVVGILKDGTKFDIFRNQPVNWARPPYFKKAYRGSRWKKYIAYSLAGNESRNRMLFLKYATRSWNAAHDESSQAVRVELYQVWQYFNPANSPVNKLFLDAYDIAPK